MAIAATAQSRFPRVRKKKASKGGMLSGFEGNQ